MKILVAEDDVNIRQGLCEIFQDEGYQTIDAANGLEAIEKYNECKPDFACLDIMMPEKSGYDVCKEIRSQNSDIPVIFISAKSEEIDKVLGLELGADDYITKPFGVREVIARIRAITRRAFKNDSQVEIEESFNMASIEIYPKQLRAKKGSEVIDLSLRDVKVLSLLYQNKGNVIDRDFFIDHCWGQHIMPESRTIDQYISQLRKKIEDNPKNPKIIQTLHGAGYRFDD